MKELIKNNKLYIVGFVLILFGLLIHTIIINLFLEGDFFYFIRYDGAPYLLWGFISIGLIVILFHSVKSHQLHKVLIRINRPITYFLILSIVLTLFVNVLNVTYGIIFVCILVVFSTVITIISNKNYIYLVILIFTIFAILEHIFWPTYNQPILLLDIVFVSTIGTELFLIVRTVLKLTRKGIRHIELNLFFDFTIIFVSVIFFASGYFLRISGGTVSEILKYPRFPYVSYPVIGYATFMIYRLWKEHISKVKYISKTMNK